MRLRLHRYNQSPYASSEETKPIKQAASPECLSFFIPPSVRHHSSYLYPSNETKRRLISVPQPLPRISRPRASLIEQVKIHPHYVRMPVDNHRDSNGTSVASNISYLRAKTDRISNLTTQTATQISSIGAPLSCRYLSHSLSSGLSQRSKISPLPTTTLNQLQSAKVLTKSLQNSLHESGINVALLPLAVEDRILQRHLEREEKYQMLWNSIQERVKQKQRKRNGILQ